MSKLITDISSFDFKTDKKYFSSDNGEVEIGDRMKADGDTKIYPRLKFMPTFEKPNEANFSLGLDHDSCGNDFNKMSCNMEVTDDVVSFIYDFLRIDLYIVNDLRFEKPSPEYEVTLLSKPKGYTSGEYKLYFSLQTKSLDFYRQPSFKSQFEDLIKEFGKEISISDTQITDLKGDILAGQPSWNLDSIACYTPFRNNKYKTGKSHHFPRPEMTDKNGFVIINYMEIKNDEMIITIPDGVLQSENYPFRHVTGATIGYTDVGGSDRIYVANYLFGMLGTGADSNQVDDVQVYARNNAGSSNIKGVIVEASGKTIISNGITNGAASPSSYGWVNLTFATKPSISNQNYFISAVADGVGNLTKYDSTGSNTRINDSSNSYTTPTNPTDGSTANYSLSMFADISASGGATRRRYTIT